MAQSKISENKFYQRAKEKASRIVGDKDKMNDLVNASKDKLGNINFEDSKVSRMAINLRIMSRMVKAYAKGSYRELPWKSLTAIVAGLVYFLMPIDLLPDFIPFTGLLDDFTVIMLLSGAFRQDIEEFLIWEGDSK
jgi:uncharacterized membrane protein YkvA (DUF1232 family)